MKGDWFEYGGLEIEERRDRNHESDGDDLIRGCVIGLAVTLLIFLYKTVEMWQSAH